MDGIPTAVIALFSGLGASVGTFVTQRLLEAYKLRSALRTEAQRARISALTKVFAAIYEFRDLLNEFEMDFAERSLANKKMDAALLEGVRKLHRAMSETYIPQVAELISR